MKYLDQNVNEFLPTELGIEQWDFCYIVLAIASPPHPKAVSDGQGILQNNMGWGV